MQFSPVRDDVHLTGSAVSHVCVRPAARRGQGGEGRQEGATRGLRCASVVFDFAATALPAVQVAHLTLVFISLDRRLPRLQGGRLTADCRLQGMGGSEVCSRGGLFGRGGQNRGRLQGSVCCNQF